MILAAAIAGAVLVTGVVVNLLRGAVLSSDFNSTRVVERLKEDFPAFSADRVVFDSAGKGALVLPAKSGPLGFVWQLQNKTVTRLLVPEQLRSWSVDGPQLKLRLGKIGLVSPTLLIDDPDDLIEIQRVLNTG